MRSRSDPRNYTNIRAQSSVQVAWRKLRREVLVKMKVTLSVLNDGALYRREDKQNYRTPAILRIFIDKDLRKIPDATQNNRPGMENIEADLLWRRACDFSKVAKDKSFQQQIVEIMRSKLGWADLDAEFHFGFSRFAGCSMCPCSPGIVVQYKNYQGIRNSYVVWVTLED